uniref:Scarecrow-like protein 14 n=1 Tax=Anthurium amnicola TaxID=1678845 RepID=A0A1D1Z9Z2_9ARAE
MAMESGIREMSGVIEGFRLADPLLQRHGGAVVGTLKPEDPEGFFYHTGLIDPPLILLPGDDAAAEDGVPASTGPSSSYSSPSSDDSEIFSDMALSYIADMLMEEEEEVDAYDGHEKDPALQAAVKPFYDVLGQQYPPPTSPDRHPLSADSPEDGSGGHAHRWNSINSGGSHRFEFGENPSPQIGCIPLEYSSQTSLSSSSSSGSGTYSYSGVPDGLEGPHRYYFGTGGGGERINESDIDIEPVWQYRRGVEEAIKFLPAQSQLVIDLEAVGNPGRPHQARQDGPVEVKVERGEEKASSFPDRPPSRSRKNPHEEGLEVEQGRSTKQSAVSNNEEEDAALSEMFDRVLLCPMGRPDDAISTLREALQNEVSRARNGAKGSNGSGGGGRRRRKQEVVDLRTLLVHCAQAVATDDRRSAGELLKQVRQHSSPRGEGSQRLAHCFADGLEARLAGTGSELYHNLESKRSAATILKAYHLYLAACPFKKISYFFSNQTILDAAEGKPSLHIIDLGIYFGFQWPCLIQRLSVRPGGPPRLRITGIELPQPGFRPAQRLEETGRRLAHYARTFGVPFEYRPVVAARWEDIDFDADPDLRGGGGDEEVLVVNCQCRLRQLADETVVEGEESPRDRVLRGLRRMGPDVLVHGVVNGAYGSAPFFATRFREALFHYTALFDMMEATVPGDRPERLVIEREMFGREAMNVVACEGKERVERPETYRQWTGRNGRAGLEQLPLNQDMLSKARDKVRSCYHKDFLVDQDGGWLLQGWKGRILYAHSAWRPKPPNLL